jgi:hypothetical protein
MDYLFFLIILQEKIDTVTVLVENAEEEEVEWLGHVE